jgi:hypothetical protein
MDKKSLKKEIENLKEKLAQKEKEIVELKISLAVCSICVIA